MKHLSKIAVVVSCFNFLLLLIVIADLDELNTFKDDYDLSNKYSEINAKLKELKEDIVNSY
tara:strand:- start:5 stop:187 length:183 start_codon:yes stop_codon:yes gene_type:complete